MDAQTTYTPQQAVKYYMAHVSEIDLGELIRNMAVHEPGGFVQYLQSVTGKEPRQLAMLMAKNQPDTFMRRATFENRHFEAARYIVNELKFPSSAGKVPAIKKLRETWGLGLREAKDIVDTVQDELSKMRLIGVNNGQNKMTAFDDTMHNIYLKIMEAAL